MAESAQIEVSGPKGGDGIEGETSGDNSAPNTDKSISQKLLFWKKDSNTRRPPDNKWLQQQIPACRPVFTAISAFIGFMIIGVAFLIIGALFTAFSARLREISITYEDCAPLLSDEDMVRGFSTCEDYLQNISSISNVGRRDLPDCHCSVNINVPVELRAPWNFYYGLDNFYQNHRRYLNSWDVSQLRGSSFLSPSSNCRPITRLTEKMENSTQPTEVPVVLCGLIANSFFNDSFDLFEGQRDNTTVTLDRTNIAWSTDRSIRFRNPEGRSNVSVKDLRNTTMPPNWPRSLAEIGNGLQNESLMVWYRVAAFPWFKKLYGRPSVNGVQSSSLPAGTYTVTLTYNFPVRPFGGGKRIVMSEVNALGGRNIFLGAAYLVMGFVLVVSAVVLLLMHLFFSKWKLSGLDK